MSEQIEITGTDLDIEFQEKKVESAIDPIQQEIFEKERQYQLQLVSSYMNSPLTDEQMEFAKDFTRNIISFSDAGTGKTHTLIAGLIMAQSFYKVPGKSINCMSFTRAAVAEIAGRYEKLCKKAHVAPTVVFNTFHSISNAILKNAYPRMRIVSTGNVKLDVEDMTRYLKNNGVAIDEGDTRFVRKVIRAVNDLNSALIFHPEHVKQRYSFIELGMDINAFQEIRRDWFLRGINNDYIVQGDIPLYCLYALMRNPDIIRKWKGKYKIMVVDEFQDLSLLHLHILSYIAETLIVVGDMKQQIYAFNGACPQIVREYYKLHPDAVQCNLTKSFRCSQKISEFATAIIKQNDKDAQPFKGHENDSSISIVKRSDLNWKEIAENLEIEFKKRKSNDTKGRDVMFLYRNNASTIPLIEELYRKGIEYRCSKLTTVMEVPMFETLSKLANAAWQPKDFNTVNEALKVFPEFKDTMYGTETFPVQAMRSSGKSLFELNYKYKENSSYAILDAMRKASECIQEKKSAGVVYMKLMDVYKKYIFKNEWWKLDNTEEFYFNLVAPVCNNKTYPLMYNEELDKKHKNETYIHANIGVRCYTMHSAKGLEADDVYILDCDEGTFPNSKIMDAKLKSGCLLDVAIDIRSERNLLYVAITRAKDHVVISYSGAQPTKLVVEPTSSDYCKYDEVYASNDVEYDDAAEFFKLFNLGGQND